MSSYRPVRTSGSAAADASGPYGRQLAPPQRIGGAAAAAAGGAVPPPPPSTPKAVSTLWVGSLVPSVTDDDIFDAFAPYGFVTDVNLKTATSSSGQVEAFVKYSYRSEAEDALGASLNRQLKVKDKTVTCRWAQEDIVNLAQLKSEALSTAAAVAAVAPPVITPRPGGAAGSGAFAQFAGRNFTAPKVWLGNLPMGTTEDEVRKVCRAYGGEVVDIIIHKQPSQYGQLSGFLRFKTQLETDMMVQAIKAGAIQINGATLKADWARGAGR